MDRNAAARKRRQAAPQPARPPAHALREKAAPQSPSSHGTEQTSSGSPGKIRFAKEDNRRDSPKSGSRGSQKELDDDASSARHFTVGNVGRGGTLYLKPSRLPPQQFAVLPATPPATSDGVDTLRPTWSHARRSDASGIWTPKVRGSMFDHNVSIPPVSLANAQVRRRTRSHSFSSTGDRHGSTASEAGAIQLRVNGRESVARDRYKSSLDLDGGLLALHIPNYRLGSPRFTDLGTAYLHNSFYTNISDDEQSSVFSHQDLERLFPLPPGNRPTGRRGSRISRHSSAPFLHPSTAYNLNPSRSPAVFAISPGITTVVFDKIEANLNDPSIVRYSAVTGRIEAATIPRLIVQITSSRFLDYELLSDFFLTFRSFLSAPDLLDWLVVRFRWAIANDSEAGKIVRVRTFVAIRHWILNYFGDDFLPAYEVRQRFCDAVNQLGVDLCLRPDRGTSDLNIVGELKKCWRRTSALFWPVPNVMNAAVDTEIVPGGGSADGNSFAASAISLPLVLRQGWASDDNPAVASTAANDPAATGAITPEHRLTLPASSDIASAFARKSSVATSPMSEDSLQVLSCSIPFLRSVKPDGKAVRRAEKSAPRPAVLQRQNSLKGHTIPPEPRHRRSVSFNDALRDDRPPFKSARNESVDIKELHNITITGGLVRGLLLQPPPSIIVAVAPHSPALEPTKARSVHQDEDYFDERALSHQAVKRIVGDVRRALSVKKATSEASNRSQHSGGSSASRASNNLREERKPHGEVSHSTLVRSQDSPRHDALAARIEDSYQFVLQGSPKLEGPQTTTPPMVSPERYLEKALPKRPASNRWDPLTQSSRPGRFASHITSSSRSIVIVDGTKSIEMPTASRGIQSTSSTSSGMMPMHLLRDGNAPLSMHGYYGNLSPTHYSVQHEGNEQKPHSIDGRLHQSFLFPEVSKPAPEEKMDSTMASSHSGRSSSNRSSMIDGSRAVRNQLRRRPGGDLKAADHVRELDHVPRNETSPSIGSQPFSTSAATSPNFSDTHFSGQNLPGQMENRRRSRAGSVGLVDRASSHPHLRPSFRADARALARVPERKRGGGVEDALLKLEGKAPDDRLSSGSWLEGANDVPEPVQQTHKTVKSKPSGGIDFEIVSPRTETQGASIYHISDADYSEEATTAEWTPTDARRSASLQPSVSRDGRLRVQSKKKSSAKSSSRSVSVRRRAGENGRMAHPESEALPLSDPYAGHVVLPEDSFLLDDDESLSEISTDIADDGDEDSFGVRSFFFDDTVDDEPRFGLAYRPPATPPSTSGGANRDQLSERSVFRSPASHENASHKLKVAASTPRLRETQATGEPAGHEVTEAAQGVKKAAVDAKTQQHLPFVLAFESEVIAEQLSIIEKDALDEMEWKDLISLNWQQSPPHVRNWADYLKREDPNGIDLIIARFNLVVKWAVSECILTQSSSERALCLTKYIHIAMHCLRLRNYASMYQITLALLSSDLARLTKTWALVAPAEKQMLARLETLCQPLRNFQNLRAEMESSTLADSCIPFIGLYTHDLMWNAQKPARLEPDIEGETPLVNFERYQTAATITKNLLRLLEASTRYEFRPHPEALSRCLWLAALEDAEISGMIGDLE